MLCEDLKMVSYGEINWRFNKEYFGDDPNFHLKKHVASENGP